MGHPRDRAGTFRRSRTLGVLAGNYAGLLNGVVLVSCPVTCAPGTCIVAAARFLLAIADRLSRQRPGGNPGRGGHRLGRREHHTRLAEAYIGKAREAGLPARVQIVGGGHNFNGALASTAISALGGMTR